MVLLSGYEKCVCFAWLSLTRCNLIHWVAKLLFKFIHTGSIVHYNSVRDIQTDIEFNSSNNIPELLLCMKNHIATKIAIIGPPEICHLRGVSLAGRDNGLD